MGPSGVLDAEALRVLCIQPVPPEALRVCCDDPADGLPAERTFRDIETNVPTRGYLRKPGAIFDTVAQSEAGSRLDRLERRNELLATELARAHELVEFVNDSIQVISERDRRVRLLSGLEPTDPEVQQAGIGGPLGASSERELILSETEEGLQALEMSMQLSSLVRRANLLASSFDAAAESLATQKT